MPSRPTFKQEDSFGPSDNVFELKSYSGETATARTTQKYPGTSLAEDNEENHKGATPNDQRDMDRLGKKQELRVSREYRSCLLGDI